MSYPVYHDGEITIQPRLTKEHAAVVLAFSRREYNLFTEPIFARVETSAAPYLPWSTGLFNLSEDRSRILPEEDESGHDLRVWIALLIEHYLSPLGYVLNGTVTWETDHIDDRGCIFVKDNVVEDVFDVVVNPGPSWEPRHYADDRLKQILRELVDSSDDTGCTEDLTVVEAKYVTYLREALRKL